MKKILLALLLLMALGEARDSGRDFGMGLGIGGHGIGFLISQNDWKGLYYMEEGSGSLDYEFYGYELGSSLDFYLGIGILYNGADWNPRLPLGIDWQLTDAFDLFFEYVLEYNFSSNNLAEDTVIGLRISF